MQDFNEKEKGYFKIEWGRQGGVILGYIVVLLGYYGIIANTVMFDQYGYWISFTEMDKSLLIFTYKTLATIGNGRLRGAS